MKTRTAILGSLAWFALVLGLGSGTLWYAWEKASARERRTFESRTNKMVGAGATFTTIGWGIIWVTWAAKRRRANDG